MAGSIIDEAALDVTDEMKDAIMSVRPIVSDDGQWIVLCFRRRHMDWLYFYQRRSRGWRLELLFNVQELLGGHQCELDFLSWGISVYSELLLFSREKNGEVYRWKKYPSNPYSWTPDGRPRRGDIDVESRYSAHIVRMNHGPRKGRTLIRVRER